ncbi:hypothetical protein ACXZ7E_23085 [Paenibacillus lautus]
MKASVPKRENELKGSPPSKVMNYKLDPDELAQIVGKPIPASHTKPIKFRSKSKGKE